jgi:hypothetical protein
MKSVSLASSIVCVTFLLPKTISIFNRETSLVALHWIQITCLFVTENNALILTFVQSGLKGIREWKPWKIREKNDC